MSPASLQRKNNDTTQKNNNKKQIQPHEQIQLTDRKLCDEIDMNYLCRLYVLWELGMMYGTFEEGIP